MKKNQTIAQFLGITDFPFIIKDDNGNSLYNEYSDKFWWKKEFDSIGRVTYYENSGGIWWKREYDSNGNETYFEFSNGISCGTKRIETGSLEGDTLIHNGQVYKLVR